MFIAGRKYRFSWGKFTQYINNSELSEETKNNSLGEGSWAREIDHEILTPKKTTGNITVKSKIHFTTYGVISQWYDDITEEGQTEEVKSEDNNLFKEITVKHINTECEDFRGRAIKIRNEWDMNTWKYGLVMRYSEAYIKILYVDGSTDDLQVQTLIRLDAQLID